MAMRIGVVCEGLTDFLDINALLPPSLLIRDIQVTLIDIQPELDASKPEGGWGNVLYWLKQNPPSVRIPSYFGGGLFDNNLSSKACDLLLVHLDADVLADIGFVNFLEKSYALKVQDGDHEHRKRTISAVIDISASLSDCSAADKKKHIKAIAVQSTETWAAASFWYIEGNPETLTGGALATAFMSALETSEGKRPEPGYANIDKTVARRKKFSSHLGKDTLRLESQCPSFLDVVTQILDGT
jgi:hypothetical protein